MNAPNNPSARTALPTLPYASPTQGSTAPVLTPEHMAQLAAARKVGGRLRRAVIFGKIDAWTTGVFGIITLVCSIGSINAMVLGAGMTVLAFLQLRAADRLLRLDPKAPAAMVRNQIILGALLFLYGAVALAMVMRNPTSLATSVGATDPEMAQMLAPYEALAQSLFIAVYAGVMAAAIIGPGLAAAYYWAQRKHIEAYRNATPQWIRDLQSAGVTL